MLIGVIIIFTEQKSSLSCAFRVSCHFPILFVVQQQLSFTARVKIDKREKNVNDFYQTWHNQLTFKMKIKVL